MSDLFLGAPTQQAAEPAASRRARQRGKARKAKERRKRRRRSIVVIVMALALVLGAGYVVWSVVGPMISRGGGEETVTDFPGPGSGQVEVVIASGDTGGVIGQKLVDAGVVATTEAFTAAFNANPDAPSIQPGTYTLALQQKASAAVSALLNGGNRSSLKLTVQEGLRSDQVFEKIYDLTGIPVADLQAAVADPALGLPAEAGGDIEGWLYPLTYQIEKDTTAVAVLQPMVAKTVEVLTTKGVPQDQWKEVLVKASIVEREAKLDEDRPKVARGIENRLARQMRLEIDATTTYFLKVQRGPSYEENHDESNPYSTYVRVGLPPGPIASPGEKSIDAVLAPAEGPWIFWVSVNLETGETRFTDDWTEHQANVQLLRQWQAENAG